MPNITLAHAVLKATGDVLSHVATQRPVLAAVAGGLVATCVFFAALLRLTQDEREPPVISTGIPFFSPIIGTIRWGMGFYTHMREKHSNLSIYTLRVPGVRLYVVNSTHLIPVVQRQYRTLLFSPISVWASEVAMGGSKEAVRIVSNDMVTNNGFMPGLAKVIHSSLSHGPAVDELNRKVFDNLATALVMWVTRHTDGLKVNMYEWIRHELFMATTDCVYGPHNPFRDFTLEADWQTFHPTIMFLMLNLLPAFAFRRALAARERLAAAWLAYHAGGHYQEQEGASAFISRWTAYFTSHGIPALDIARFHTANMFGLTANTIPTAFYVLFHLYSDKELLRACRAEVEQAIDIVRADDAGEEREEYSLSVKAVREQCPTLVAMFQEVLRVHSIAHSMRVAQEDVWLDGGAEGRWLLKKGGILMMPASVQHQLKEVWGEDADAFDHRRFLRSGKVGEPRPNPVAFRGFGGGTTLCPGRHFATTEVLLFSAMMLLKFDIVPVGDGDGDGRWVLPTTAKSSQAEGVEQPDYDIQVELRPRPGAERKWRLSFEGARQAALVAEDL